ncbi:mitochondroal chaperone, putative [Perkinsus marinus ATCC 50983]|uniref:Mitochondroal chaperone, putative n=1 Tax=Perkinsus marinus (strain ATCC 50983 / TXsc) TaxID=423536 RepID=C5L4H8_PERM5|nr:mitochondroal chaperone, putative [Perkinsus marinus ATCC 50983]EER08415.1 mitochondroal chaperone, putative [Perkinsus marinus ATCC 50983]|eukprot:XP_002776599.1 mitochondroal chaperone, putative [Perkinsus marinus ATCC 50983]
MSARGEPSTRQVYLCPDEFATVKQTYPNSTSPVSIQQSEVTITYNSMSLCMSKAFNFMKNTGLIRRDTSTLTYLLLALNETWFVTGPDSKADRLPLYTAGNHIQRCSKATGLGIRPISGVYCASTYSLNATNADESRLGALGQGLFVTDYAPVTEYHPSIFVGAFNFIGGGVLSCSGVETNHCKDMAGRMTTSFDFIPSTGRHFMKFNGAWMLVERERNNSTVDITTGSPWETLTLTTLAWNVGKFEELLVEAQSMAANREEGKTVIYNATGHEWRPFGNPKTVRPFESVILDGAAAETIASDVKEFLSTGSWYLQRGIPYRRGYLFYGPPGCGKTSYIMALAGHIQYNIAVLNLGDPTMSDDRLQRLLATVPPKCLILLEDVDCVLPEYEPSEKPQDPRRQGIRPMTFSGLLNALDGVGSTEERLVFMTTNRPSFLPPVLVRPGRVDVKVHVGLATRDQMQRMFMRFYPDSTEWAEEFARKLEGTPLSLADIQGYFLFFKNDPEGCLENVGEFAERVKSQR